MVLSKDYINSVCEIKSFDNKFFSIGRIKHITPQFIQINAMQDKLHLFKYKDSIKLFVINSALGSMLVSANIHTSSADIIQAVNVQKLTAADKRVFFRVNTNIEGKIIIFSEEALLNEGNFNFEEEQAYYGVTIKIKDISLTGLLFESEEILKQGDLLDIEFSIMNKQLKICCEIARVIPIKDSKTFKYGCTFENASETEVDLICKFIFENQIGYDQTK